jgi:mono/diheme cytochrome c family protein
MRPTLAAALGAVGLVFALSLGGIADGHPSQTTPIARAPAEPIAPTPPVQTTPKPVAAHPASRPGTTPATDATELAPGEQTALVKQYCVTCHNDKASTGGLSLAVFDAAAVADDPAVAEKVIRKLRAGMMPPSGARRPDKATLAALATAFEMRIDRAASVRPNPGARPSQRLNRAEYARAVNDLLGIDVDATAFLPADTISESFDNIADAQMISPTLMEGYLRAASQISRMAVGDRYASASSTRWKVPRTSSQMRHVDGAPFGTRGGLSVTHVFPADGEYQFKLLLHSGPTGDLFGAPYRGEQIDVSIDGERVALLDVNPRMNEQDPNGLNMFSPRIHVKAGPRRVSAAFVQRFEGPVDDLMMPVEHTLADTNIGEVFGVTALTHIRDFTVTGPYVVTACPRPRAVVASSPAVRRRQQTSPPALRTSSAASRRRRIAAGWARTTSTS